MLECFKHHARMFQTPCNYKYMWCVESKVLDKFDKGFTLI